MCFQREQMKSPREAATAEVVRPPVAGDAPPMPSEDQVYFDESLRYAAQRIGGLIRARRKAR